jgi:hypothetical protein
MAIGELIKKHPIASAGGGLVLFIVFYAALSGGSPSSADGTTVGGMSSADYQATVAASSQLQAAQLAAQLQAQQTNAAVSVQQAAIAAQVTQAQLNAQTQQNQDSLAAQIAALQTNNNTAVQEQSNTLAAQVATANLNTQEQIAQLNASVQTSAQQVALGMLQSNNATTLGMAQISGDVQKTTVSTLANQNIAIAQTNAYSNIMTANANKKQSFCFITTAVCEVLGKADDCEELQTLRRYRNGWLSSHAWGKSLIDNYSIVGPLIVQSIERRSDKEEYCKRLYSDYIAPSVQYVQNELPFNALEVYLELVNKCLRDGLAA